MRGVHVVLVPPTQRVSFSNLILGFGDWLGLIDELLYTAQSVNFFTLILMQWGCAVCVVCNGRGRSSFIAMARNLFATRGRKLSILQHRPTSNPRVFAGAGAALCIGIISFHYVPWFHGIFQTRPVPVEFFFIPLSFARGLLLLDEVRKLIVRQYPKSLLARIAW